MYNKIIISLSLNHGISAKAIEAARTLLNDGGTIVAVHVYEPMQGSVGAYVTKEAVKESLEKAEASLAERVASEKDIEALLIKGHSGRALIEHAEKIGADCIVVGSHKPGLSDHFLGSTASRIARYATCSVHVLR
jgi:nucleotide-binding universal stress UspA family protein